MQWIPICLAFMALIFTASVTEAIEPNFEDIDDAKSEPQNEVVNIEQDSPHSNAIHIAHNIPTGSDITVTQKNPYNSTVHISLNIGKDCKVKVDMSDAVNSVLHVSLSNPRNSQVEVTMNNAFNCSLHIRYTILHVPTLSSSGKSLLELWVTQFSSRLTATLNLCPIYLKLLVHVF